MSSRGHEEDDELSEEQRIALLEKSVSSNKIILLVVALILIILISVGITTGIISAMSNNEEKIVKLEDFQAAQNQIVELNKRLDEQNKKIDALVKAYPQLKNLLKNGSMPTVQRLLLEQEKSIQEFLSNMKAGMYDLAHMVPGSRTWLEMYNEQMNKAISESQNRARELKKLPTGQPLIEPNF